MRCTSGAACFAAWRLTVCGCQLDALHSAGCKLVKLNWHAADRARSNGYVAVQMHLVDLVRLIDKGHDGDERAHADQDFAVFLLYSDGHCDLLYPCGTLWRSLPRQA